MVRAILYRLSEFTEKILFFKRIKWDTNEGYIRRCLLKKVYFKKRII